MWCSWVALGVCVVWECVLCVCVCVRVHVRVCVVARGGLLRRFGGGGGLVFYLPFPFSLPSVLVPFPPFNPPPESVVTGSILSRRRGPIEA